MAKSGTDTVARAIWGRVAREVRNQMHKLAPRGLADKFGHVTTDRLLEGPGCGNRFYLGPKKTSVLYLHHAIQKYSEIYGAVGLTGGGETVEGRAKRKTAAQEQQREKNAKERLVNVCGESTGKKGVNQIAEHAKTVSILIILSCVWETCMLRDLFLLEAYILLPPLPPKTHTLSSPLQLPDDSVLRMCCDFGSQVVEVRLQAQIARVQAKKEQALESARKKQAMARVREGVSGKGNAMVLFSFNRRRSTIAPGFEGLLDVEGSEGEGGAEDEAMEEEEEVEVGGESEGGHRDKKAKTVGMTQGEKLGASIAANQKSEMERRAAAKAAAAPEVVASKVVAERMDALLEFKKEFAHRAIEDATQRTSVMSDLVKAIAGRAAPVVDTQMEHAFKVSEMMMKYGITDPDMLPAPMKAFYKSAMGE